MNNKFWGPDNNMVIVVNNTLYYICFLKLIKSNKSGYLELFKESASFLGQITYPWATEYGKSS